MVCHQLQILVIIITIIIIIIIILAVSSGAKFLLLRFDFQVLPLTVLKLKQGIIKAHAILAHNILI